MISDNETRIKNVQNMVLFKKIFLGDKFGHLGLVE